ncbi:MAG: hypothetical protein E7046_11300 [Lentisphaerae bacterium]|jgi:L-ascorbate metabolism protein UlaG (beta-lactamase superfamily)|nr:hypothetical protein [Lentisphaerota bacterium]
MEILPRRDFLMGAAAFAALPPLAALSRGMDCPSAAQRPIRRSEERQGKLVANWQRAAADVLPEDYVAYQRDGDTRDFKVLVACERAFDKVLREAQETVVAGDVPAIWSVYNMGYIVKTRKSLFSIDLRHRRDCEFASLLDFALITHNHPDHWRRDFYRTMTDFGKIVASNFLKDNLGFNAIKGESAKCVGTYSLGDVEIRTSLIDHFDAAWGIDFTMAYEIKIGNFILYHTGDSGRGTVPKLNTVWGQPDLWLFFPGCGINVADAVRKVNAKRIVFGHLWELGHAESGRLNEPRIRRALAAAKPICNDTSVAFWGDRII